MNYEDKIRACADCECFKFYKAGMSWAYCDFWHQDKQPTDICENFTQTKKQ